TVDSMILAIVMVYNSIGKWRPKLRLLGDNVPSVDVIVAVCNERIDIVQDTVRAALNADYPKNRFRVIVADDGRSQKLEAWILQLAVDTPNLHYTARAKNGGKLDYKAGNLNHAMRFAETLPGGAAKFVAGLDADMIPERRWLRAVAAHIVRDSEMGMVCPTQLFYNMPNGDPLCQSSLINWKCADIFRDHVGCGWNLGSGWIVRRLAIDDINGFPTDCLVEDICSSMLAMAEGWKTAYIPEGLQYGLVPETYLGHVKQVSN
ncbi:nucleotide-diphospho-sugar transferase, partial [Lasiosphaeria ovina]